MPIKTIFLDRDGVINKEVGYLSKKDDFIFIDGIFLACRKFSELGYRIIIVTNQSGIARGLYSIIDYQKLTKWMLNEFENNNVFITDVFYCPHDPKASCKCRKPNPGMLLEAKKKYSISMKNSWLIGDKETDIQAARSAGINNTILVKSGHQIDALNTEAKFVLNSVLQSIDIIN